MQRWPEKNCFGCFPLKGPKAIANTIVLIGSNLCLLWPGAEVDFSIGESHPYTHSFPLSFLHTHTHTSSVSISYKHTHTYTLFSLSLSHTHTHTLSFYLSYKHTLSSHTHTHTYTRTHTHSVFQEPTDDVTLLSR